MAKRAPQESKGNMHPVESLKRAWREGALRKQTRQATGLDDAAIERALAAPERQAELAQYAQVILRESLLPVLQAVVERAQEENTAARLFAELAGAARLAGWKGEDEPTPEEELSALERAMVANLRELLREETA